MTSIYGLYDQTGALRYIGKANNVRKRVDSHLRDCRRRSGPVQNWLKKNGRPEVRVLYQCSEGDDWRQIERQLISEARARGEKLLNVADGGDEPFCSIETRRANGRNSAQHGFLANLKNDQLAKAVFSLKRESASLLRFYRKHGLVEYEQRHLEKIRYLYARLPHLFPKWAGL